MFFLTFLALEKHSFVVHLFRDDDSNVCMNVYIGNVLVQWNSSVHFSSSFVNILNKKNKEEYMINVFAVFIWFTRFLINEMLVLDYYWNVTWIASRFLNERAKIISGNFSNYLLNNEVEINWMRRYIVHLFCLSMRLHNGGDRGSNKEPSPKLLGFTVIP